eukprot:CAMPEP_0113532706 /NCGR_PEP_ID=MMETSP0015_2-20120614/4206_1 /TAXON_ID=2838 /ORGANISM="Odontella" /LENGTH=116 /DNA_ID=CAMNT_0000431693 /DNA_START=23 /DNA_END=370 /DNA_ORIENTATION=- /assembly_acc=CAM_ASM_000160
MNSERVADVGWRRDIAVASYVPSSGDDFFLRHGHDDNMVTHTLEHNIVMIEPIDRDVWTDPATFHFPAPAAAPPVPPPFLYNAAAGILQGAFSGLIHAIPRRIHWQLRRTGTIVVG